MNHPMTPPLHPERPGVVRIDAAGLADAVMGVVAPASILLDIHPDQVTVLGVGQPAALDAPDLPRPDRTVALPDRLLLPALVNAHTHLDLTHLGPFEHSPGHGFVAWVERIRAGRRSEPDGIADAVRLGIDLSIRGGTVAVGDIAGAPAGRLTEAPARALAASPLAGVSYLEFFGIGKSAAGAADRVARLVHHDLPSLRAAIGDAPVRIGLQPHAPNTVDLGVYRWTAALADRHGLPLSTHLAETPEERTFIAAAAGPQRAMLERFGIWDDSALDHVGRGLHPVAHLAPVLARSRVLCAHVNDAPDEAVSLLASTRTPVVYCPRASAYFGAEGHFGPHRYRDMLAAGVPVCLGTDSIVNLDTRDRISVLDEVRLLHRRDGAEPRTLLAMATTHGASALGLAPGPVSLMPGPLAGLLAIPVETPGRSDPAGVWASAMMSNNPPEVLFLNRECF
jgi:cytosine/adenosine deaminase-related metal-dependent hydrolase